ncbi:helix-turn-helix transcriptional regulator [Loigolactobacillus binensis]|uniref:Helix-turn-helix transcriptional regulator n=1 Tax=Loigolactobacillus binensis TaxID=2559922 RepID=A0ABW3EEX6_9LACO|nr:helix-turn-helix transcriptional regulator [Loigolactobacillus binensis]
MIQNKLRVLRAERRWSQTDLAQRLDVTRQTVAAIENGKYSLSLQLAFKIARVFQVDLSVVFQDVPAEGAEKND